jgi:acyl-CoA synthetase (NDP forming)
MLEARSVAVVGASDRPGSVGEQMLRQLLDGGFDGEVHPVNPRYDELAGRRCVPSIGDAPGPVDLALLGVPNAALEETLTQAATAGTRSAVIFASGHEEPGEGPSLLERLATIARGAEMAICGGNCMGFVNVERGLRALAFPERAELEPGGIALVSHSGSVFSAFLRNERGLRCNIAVSAGQELVTTVADYLTYALTLPSTRVVALFLETVRDPDGFRAALKEAARRDVPVVVLKVGREAAAKELIQAHSGALAGDEGAYEAVFETHGAHVVESLDEMADALELFAAGRRAGPGGLAAILDSGGERAHLIDVAAREGVPFASISPETIRKLGASLDPGLPPVNPLDAWGTGRDHERIFAECIRALADDPETAAFAYAVDLAGEDTDPSYTGIALEVLPGLEVPGAVLTNLTTAVAPGAARSLRDAGVPVLEGTATGLAAFRHLFAYRDHRALPALEPPAPISDEVRHRWRTRLRGEAPWTEPETMQLLSDYGIPVVPEEEAGDPEEVGAAAARIGFPVAVKTLEAAHKSDVDGVRLGLRSADQVLAAYADLAGRLGPRVVVAGMAPRGVELALGIVRDEQFGPVVLVAAGGILLEVAPDRRLALPPLDDPRAMRLVDGLGIRPALDGVRGAPPSDVASVARALVRLSLLAADLGDDLDALDVNPLIASPIGCIAADALVVPRVR